MARPGPIRIDQGWYSVVLTPGDFTETQLEPKPHTVVVYSIEPGSLKFNRRHPKYWGHVSAAILRHAKRGGTRLLTQLIRRD